MSDVREIGSARLRRGQTGEIHNILVMLHRGEVEPGETHCISLLDLKADRETLSSIWITKDVALKLIAELADMMREDETESSS